MVTEKKLKEYKEKSASLKSFLTKSSFMPQIAKFIFSLFLKDEFFISSAVDVPQ